MHITINNTLKKWSQKIWSVFLRGLFALLPLTLTIAIFKTSFNLLHGWLSPLRRLLPTFFELLPRGAEFLAVVLFIIGVGLIMRGFFIRPLLHWFESLLFKIPLVRPVYAGTKQLVKAFSPGDGQGTFKYVVMIEYPRHGVYTIGFIANQLHPDLAPEKTERYFSIFIPSVPNPATGNIVVLPESAITLSAMSRQDAMAMIISGGIIQPENYQVTPPVIPLNKE